jgi:membrane protease YdiL (CAAX protease family)
MFPEPLLPSEQAAPPIEPAPGEPPSPPRRRGHPVIAWLVIVAVTTATVWLQQQRDKPKAGGEDSGAVVMELQAKCLIGARQLMDVYPQGAVQNQKTQAKLEQDAETLNQGPPSRRLRFVVLVGELQGPQAALDRLTELQQKFADRGVELSVDDWKTIDILQRLYRDLKGDRKALPSLPESEQEYLREHLGWFGRLAQSQAKPAGDAERNQLLTETVNTILLLLGGMAVVLVVGFFGLVGLLIFLSGLWTGRLCNGLHEPTDHGGIYAETFALWMFLYVSLTIVVALVTGPGLRLPLSGAAMIVSAILALFWPVIRGIPWRQVRQDIGWTRGRGLVFEPLLGIATYAMALPLMFVGLMLTLLLLKLQNSLARADTLVSADMPTHPVVQLLVQHDWFVRLQILVLAAVIAPIVEETMFRGVLYRHLRDGSWFLPRFVSFLFSATVASFVFAAVHPQGLATIPALMSLAYAFTLAREWRGTLLPAMVAHGINNAVVILLLIYALG